ncbi:hypothetical protein [Streptomyces sp. MAR4 CNX-425]|uniref:hypothetical protein n=1 Tax=Streptomyces sp. MAR4 CNX-425 TaxID=3406343 RepID=UPI003B514B33
MTTIYCPRCDSRHDPAGAPWCAPPRSVPEAGSADVYGTLERPALHLPAAAAQGGPGPAPGDLELFADRARSSDADRDEAESGAGGGRVSGVGAELVPLQPRSRHRRYKPRSRRLAGLAAAGMSVLSGGLLAANAMGGGSGGARTEGAVARADTPVQPLPSKEPGAGDGATPDGDRRSDAATRDAEPTPEPTRPAQPDGEAERPQAESAAPTTDSPAPSTTVPEEGRVTTPDSSETGSASPSTGTPTPTPSTEDGSGGGDGSGGSGSGGDSDDGSDRDRGGLGIDLPLLPGL